MSDTNSKPTQAQAKAVPLLERLRNVPALAVLRIDTPNPLGVDTRSIPVGVLCREAAAFIEGCADAAPAAPSRAPDAAPAGRRCHSYECRAAQRDSVLCADGRCDIEEGVRRGPDSAPARGAADESTRAPTDEELLRLWPQFAGKDGVSSNTFLRIARAALASGERTSAPAPEGEKR